MTCRIAYNQEINEETTKLTNVHIAPIKLSFEVGELVERYSEFGIVSFSKIFYKKSKDWICFC